LALQLISQGAQLVADDRTIVTEIGGAIAASAPAAIAGMIEARGVGILTLPHSSMENVALVVDLAVVETERLPQQHSTTVLDITLPCLHKVDAPYFPAAIHAYLSAIRNEV
jgi:HPr kinase/phosphorylase